MTRRSKIKLLGADKFILALESQNKFEGTSGNTCRYVMDLVGPFDLEAFKALISNNKIAQELGAFQMNKGLSKWISTGNANIPIEIINADESLPDATLIKLDKHKAPLVYFHVLIRSDSTVRIIFSWHHLLMDNYGAVLFLKNLISPLDRKEEIRFKSPFGIGTLKKMVKAKRYITKSSKGENGALDSGVNSKVQQCMRIISLSKEETKAAEAKALRLGAKFGAGTFYLALLSKCMSELLTRKGESSKNFWIPIPHDMRKKGSEWPIIGNHLSFVFYRIDKDDVIDLQKSIQSLNEQLLHQIKNDIPTSQAHLLNFMRIFPNSIYARLIKGPNGKSLSSFLFTMAAEHPKELERMFNCDVTNAFSVPPNTYPPGLTFALNQYKGEVRLVVLSYEHILADKEMDEMEKGIRNLLNE